MSDLFELNPELLLEQSQEMMNLHASYESLFSNITSDLQGVNSSWSDLLSNNFSGKISSAQKSFVGALKMLQNSANKSNYVAETALQFDAAWATRFSGSSSSFFSSKMVWDYLKSSMMDSAKDSIQDFRGFLSDVEALKEKINGELSSSQEAWLKLIGSKIGGAIKPIKEIKDPIAIATKIMEGDYMGALEELGENGVKAAVKIIAEDIQGVIIDSSDVSKYAKYVINLTENTAEGVTEFCLDPSFENFGKIVWNITAQPILDTAGSEIEKYVKLIPGISEYYYDECGAEDIGDVANIALGDFYGLITGDEDMKQYASTYYEEQGGLWEGLYNGGKEIVSFVKDSGGIGNAVKNFYETASEDFGGSANYMAENAKILFNEGKEHVNNISDFVEESGGIGNAVKKFGSTALKDIGSGIKDVSGRVWNSIFGE